MLLSKRGKPAFLAVRLFNFGRFPIERRISTVESPTEPAELADRVIAPGEAQPSLGLTANLRSEPTKWAAGSGTRLPNLRSLMSGFAFPV
jgi:hypothetical protein